MDPTNVLPINARFFLQSLFGTDSPITEKDFSASEIDVLRSAGNRKYVSKPEWARQNDLHEVGQNQAGYLPQTQLRQIDETMQRPYIPQNRQSGYEDYYLMPDRGGWADSVQKTLTDPSYRIATSLGNFGIEDQGDAYRVYDKYNWNGDFDKPVQSLQDVFKGGLTNPTLFLNRLAELYAPKTSRPVNVRVPK